MVHVNLDVIPARAQAKLSMALAFTQVKAGVDMLFELMSRHEFLRESIPKEWPFQMSLDEMGVECMICMERYRDSAMTEIAQGILDQLKAVMDKGANDNG